MSLWRRSALPLMKSLKSRGLTVGVSWNSCWLTVPCEEPGALVRAGLKLASDPAMRLRLGAGAVDAVAELSWTSVVVRFEEELASLAGGRRA